MRLSAFLRHPALLVCLAAAAGAISCAQGVGRLDHDADLDHPHRR